MEPYLSLWLSTVPGGPALPGDLDADVAIVGGGFTGLWTAYYLARLDPSLRIVLVEANFCGYGASGRNGGWCSALWPRSATAVARTHGADAARNLFAALRSTVDEVGRVAAAEGIDCDYAKGGTVVVARTAPQLVRARAAADESATFGLGLSLLSTVEARALCGATSVLGGTYSPDCAALHPGKLVRGLAAVVAGLGVRVFEGTRALRLRAGAVETTHGTVRAPVVVRAVEGYTATLPGHRRVLAPVYSLMIATDPLPEEVWAEIGLGHRATFSDYRHLIIYGQRTADGRLAFGGRGAPYHLGSRIRPAYDREPRVFADLARTLGTLFPVLGRVRPAYAWGGPLGIPRDWTPSVGYDRAAGLAWAGGYVGDGVAATNLAGRTLARLITGSPAELTTLPWVGHRWRRWEPEPLRWLGANAGLRLMTAADAEENRTGRPSRRAALFTRLLG